MQKGNENKLKKPQEIKGKEKKVKDKVAKETKAKVKKVKEPKAPEGKKKTEKGQEKSSKLHSMQTKVSSLVILGVVASVAVTLLIMISSVKDLVIDSAYGKMLNMATSYGKLIDKEEENINDGIKQYVGLSTEQFTSILGGMEITGLDNFYYYVVDKSGIIRYHTDESKIGKPNKNASITDVVAAIAKGHTPDNLCMEYEEDGETMYASYYVTANRSLMIICASGSELTRPVVEMSLKALGVALVVLVLIVIVSAIVIRRFIKPLNQVTGVINDTAKLKIKLPENMNRLCERKDETGVISRAVREMSNNLYDVVTRIDRTNRSVSDNMTKLEASSNQVHIFCTDNSATTEQLAASTEQVSNMTQSMNRHMEDMRSQAEIISRETELSNQFSEEVAGRAEEMQSSTQSAIAQTKQLYEQIREKTETALEGLSAVTKINELTAAIIEISDQTSLLSLNASIEAARAGDAGKGFAVVAQEISKLAQRSLETVNDINGIIGDVNRAVTNITESMENTTEFLEETVLVDFDNFNQTGAQYRSDADTFKERMDNISEQLAALSDSIQKVSEAVENVSLTVNETSAGVNDIAEKTAEVVNATSDNYALTGNTVESMNELREIVNRFEYE